MKENFEKLRLLKASIPKGDPAITPYLRDTMLEGDPDIVLRPRDMDDLKEMVNLCRRGKVPITVCGAQTSMTGSSAAMRGALITTEKLSSTIDISERDGIITAGASPGILLSDFKKKLEEEDLFYPVHPTSVNEAFLGGTVATNATGDDTYKYGPTRKWIKQLDVLLIDGSELILERPPGSDIKEVKGKGGYYIGGSDIDLFIGSEGTLGIITKITVQVLKGVPSFYTLMIPFPSNRMALEFIKCTDESNQVNPRSLEFIDNTALEVMKKNQSFPSLPEETRSVVFTNYEYSEDLEETIDLWLNFLDSFKLDNELIESVVPAITDKEKENMHSWRHFIPEYINETYRKYEKVGGGKVGGDWWVPKEKMLEMMDWYYELSNREGIPFIGYGHLGDGHPHTNYFTRDSEERKRAKKLILDASKKAVEMGGGVAGEHGIGKIKKYLLPVQYSEGVISKMKQIKTHYDPDWLLGPDNIF